MSAQAAQATPAMMTPGIKRAIRVDPSTFKEWLRSIRSRVEISGLVEPGKEPDVSEKTLQELVNLAITAILPLLSDGAIIVQGNDPQAFRSEARRKLVTLSQSVYEAVRAKTLKCSEMIGILAKTEESLEDNPGAWTMDKMNEAVNNCIEAIRIGFSAPLVMAYAIDVMSGALQASLPGGLIPNSLTIGLGVLKD